MSPNRRRVLEHICRYCKRTFRASAESAACNPFCSVCIQDRIAEATAGRPPVEAVLGDDGYVRFVPTPPTPEPKP